jgi:hypothetical protein
LILSKYTGKLTIRLSGICFLHAEGLMPPVNSCCGASTCSSVQPLAQLSDLYSHCTEWVVPAWLACTALRGVAG